MNPEFRRNVWLDLTPRRVFFMVGALALVFFAAAIPADWESAPSAAAQLLYYGIVVFWGTRNAATAVVGEIRDRTWDSQRLSSLGAGTMTWGKLFGSTIYNWLGGLICLAVISIGVAVHEGALAAALEAVYYLAIGIISQAVALLASLIAIRRRQSHSRLEVFLYQLAGLAAAIAVHEVWIAADPLAAIAHKPMVDTVPWWGQSIDARNFLLASLAEFAAWTFVGCYREMRLELKLRNGPLVWIAFLGFIGVYVAGFDAWLSKDLAARAVNVPGLRLALAGMAYLVLTYLTVLLDDKDSVGYRRVGRLLGAGDVGGALSSLRAWMMSYIAALTMGIALIAWLGHTEPDALKMQAVVAALLGFLTRDVAIFVIAQTFAGPRRGDFAAVIVLVALYLLLPPIVSGVHFTEALPLFYPRPGTPVWLGPVLAWAEGVAAVTIAIARLSLRERRVALAR